MNWSILDDVLQLENIVDQSQSNPVIIFKHSTRCSISALAKDRLERQWNSLPDNIIPYYLDLIQYRDISHAIAERFKVPHESPQVLLIQQGDCTYEESHNGISAADINTQIRP